jgi:hypothetical protein
VIEELRFAADSPLERNGFELPVRGHRDSRMATPRRRFRSVRRVENELWVMERNPNYWNKTKNFTSSPAPVVRSDLTWISARSLGTPPGSASTAAAREPSLSQM